MLEQRFLEVILNKIHQMFEAYAFKHQRTYNERVNIIPHETKEFFDRLMVNIKEFEEAILLGNDNNQCFQAINDSILWFLSSNEINQANPTSLACILNILAENSFITFPGILRVASASWPDDEYDPITHNSVVIDYFEKQLEGYRQDIWHRKGVHAFHLMKFSQQTELQFEKQQYRTADPSENQFLERNVASNKENRQPHSNEFVDPNQTNAYELLERVKRRKKS